jgi:hypothetical protein
MQILVLILSGIGLREIPINGIGSIFYISVGHDSKLYVADAAGDLFSVEGETGKLKQFTSPVNRCRALIFACFHRYIYTGVM